MPQSSLLPYKSTAFHDLANAYLKTTQGQVFGDAFTANDLVKMLAICLEYGGCDDFSESQRERAINKVFGTRWKEGQTGTHSYDVAGAMFTNWLTINILREANRNG